MKYICLCFTFLLFMTSLAYAGDLEIKFDKPRNNKGRIAIVIYADDVSFNENKTEQAAYTFLLKAGNVQNITLHNVPEGTYAITMMHDENNNNDLDMNKRGFPIEGYAYSNNVGEYEAPKFKEASFKHTDDKNTKMDLKIQYVK